MRKQGALIWCLISIAAVQAACSSVPTLGEPVSPLSVRESAARQGSAQALAGEWVYRDSLVSHALTLNEKGNGKYAWKEGSFVTTGFSDGLWRGTWHQRENDREGGFELRMSEDYSEGQGRWWYTRIGADTSPKQAGGTFDLTRPASQVRTIGLKSRP